LANVPTFDTDNISLGPGILFIGPAGTTPTTDVGAIGEDGATFSITREVLEVFQGSPRSLTKLFVTFEDVRLTVSTIEWNLINLAVALGAGVTTTSGVEDTISFGGDPNFLEQAVLLEHVLPVGHTVSIQIWKAQAVGEMEITLAQDELQTFPYNFRALEENLDWAGTTLPNKQRLFRIRRGKVAVSC
jgi:hypothetical protein